jgi:hypothetical protein
MTTRSTLARAKCMSRVERWRSGDVGRQTDLGRDAVTTHRPGCPRAKPPPAQARQRLSDASCRRRQLPLDQSGIDQHCSAISDQRRSRAVGSPVVAENSSEQESCCLADVPVVETTDFWKLDDSPQCRARDGSRLWSIAVQR